MWREIEPDRIQRVDVEGGSVLACEFGSGGEVLFCLNGGPGLPCDYLRETHSCLARHGYRVVAFDQLGCGGSDRPTDPALCDTETVRRALDLGRVHLSGHSWGGWLANWNRAPCTALHGPNALLSLGNLRDGNRVPDLPGIVVPTLILCGQHDQISPACSRRMQQALPNARLHCFQNASHMPFYEEPLAYYPVLLDFLTAA